MKCKLSQIKNQSINKYNYNKDRNQDRQISHNTQYSNTKRTTRVCRQENIQIYRKKRKKYETYKYIQE